MDNASDTRQLREKRKAAKLAEQARGRVVSVLMGDPERRAYIHDLLLGTHLFQTSWNSDPYAMAFAEGERNIGLRLLADITRWTPDQYIQMMREAQDRELANERRDSDDRYTSGFDGDDRPVDPDNEGFDGDINGSNIIGADR